MKRIFLLGIMISIIITACTTVEFESSVPKNTDLLYEFPENLLGTYLNKDNDTLQIDRYEFSYGNKKSIFFHINRSLKSEEIELKRFDDNYILNLKEEKSWNIIPFIYDKDKISIYYIGIEKDMEKVIVDKIKGITSIREIKNKDGKVDKYIINPTNKELEKMFEEKVFSEILVFEKLK